ncbi:MAG: tyrosine-protein phosphatase [Terrimesophilobacter sp.]
MIGAECPVSWGGLHNVRDLGGLPCRRGVTAFGRVYRSPRLDDLDASAWGDLDRDGIRTIVDLRNDDEVAVLRLRPEHVNVVRAPIEDQTDAEFMRVWGASLGSPAYYPENLRRWPKLVAQAIAAVADAPIGGVLVHCSAGRDRTGLIAALLLDLVEVEHHAILADYELGVRATNDFLLGLQHPHERPKSERDLENAVLTARRDLGALLDELDIRSYLLSSGVTEIQLEKLHRRMLAPGR